MRAPRLVLPGATTRPPGGDQAPRQPGPSISRRPGDAQAMRPHTQARLVAATVDPGWPRRAAQDRVQHRGSSPSHHKCVLRCDYVALTFECAATLHKPTDRNWPRPRHPRTMNHDTSSPRRRIARNASEWHLSRRFDRVHLRQRARGYLPPPRPCSEGRLRGAPRYGLNATPHRAGFSVPDLGSWKYARLCIALPQVGPTGQPQARWPI